MATYCEVRSSADKWNGSGMVLVACDYRRYNQDERKPFPLGLFDDFGRLFFVGITIEDPAEIMKRIKDCERMNLMLFGGIDSKETVFSRHEDDTPMYIPPIYAPRPKNIMWFPFRIEDWGRVVNKPQYDTVVVDERWSYMLNSNSMERSLIIGAKNEIKNEKRF